MKEYIYADHAATSPMHPQVWEAMEPYMKGDFFGNPSSLYNLGQEAKKNLSQARNQIAQAMGALEEEIFFTSGGSEADNWAIKGVLQLKKTGHIITTAIEHPAVLESVKQVASSVTYLPVDADGRVSPQEVEKALREDTVLISVMAGNNEIGTLQPVAEIGKIAQKAKVLFHTDGVQALGHIPVDVNQWGCDLLSFSGHKMGGPRGIGGLYIRKGLRLPPLLHGGGQEKGRRAGTENVAGAIGMAKALELCLKQMEDATLQPMSQKLREVIETIPYARLTGHPQERLQGITSAVFEGVEGEALLLRLNKLGIYVSSGSACSSASLDPSHVLLAIGLPHEVAHGSVRISLGHSTTPEEVDIIAKTLPEVVSQLREMSPVWDEIEGKPIWYTS